VAELVARALDDDRAVVRDLARRGGLVVEILQEVPRGERVEPLSAGEARERRGARRGPQLADHPSDAAPELERPSRGIAAPERHLAGLAGRGRHQDAIVSDLLHAPRRGAEEERLADARLEDHLLVELADARGARLLHMGAPRLRTAGQEDPVEPTIGNGAAV